MASDWQSQDSPLMASINIVPFVDIILVILIVFMVTSPFIVKPTKGLDVPLAASSAKALQHVVLRVSLSQEGEIFLNQKLVPRAQFELGVKNFIQQHYASHGASHEGGLVLRALVAASAEASHGQVVGLIEALKSAGIQNVAIAVQ